MGKGTWRLYERETKGYNMGNTSGKEDAKDAKE
jgi:hypothetical protein